jgi:hypothetical protein
LQAARLRIARQVARRLLSRRTRMNVKLRWQTLFDPAITRCGSAPGAEMLLAIEFEIL